MPREPEIPERLLADLFCIDDPLLVGRYWEALEALGIDTERRPRFHIDAAGYSPQIAQDLKDPHYLRSGVLHAHAIVVSDAQLRAPLVHPSLGYAADAFRDVTRNASREIASITRREPLLAEVRQTSSHFAAAEQLADLSDFELAFRTPGGLLRGARRLEEMKDEFISSAQRWLDDDFIGQMIELAGRVSGLGALTDRFVSSLHSLALFFSPAFGGTYVLEEPGASANRATTYILTAEPGNEVGTEYRSARGRQVRVHTLDASSAVEALERHQIGHFDAGALRRGDALARIRHWLALDHLLNSDPDRALLGLSPNEVVAAMRGEGSPPAEYVELEEVGRRLREHRGRVDPESLSPTTRMRLLSCTSSRSDVRRFFGHLQVFVDPIDLERSWLCAPDLFFARLPGLSPERRAYFARWVESNGARPQ